MAPLLNVRDVRRSYDKGRVDALKGVSFALDRGETLAVVGPSGCGKSTLVNLVSGLDFPDAGDVFIDGRPIRSAAEWVDIRARRIGIVFQNFCLLPALTAAENVELALFGQIDSAGRRASRAAALLQQVGLESRATHRPAELSGGERQRVAIARAIANSPDLLLADEPTGNLDRATGEMVLAVMREAVAAVNAAMLLVTHDPAAAAQCSRRIDLLDGEIAGDTAGAPRGSRFKIVGEPS